MRFLVTFLSLLACIAFGQESGETKNCFLCNGKGALKCDAPRCADGKRDCPAPCLKLSVGKWEKMDVPGHGSHEVWQKFYYGPGKKKGWKAYPNTHVGNRIVVTANDVTDAGPCTTCNKTTKVDCDKCKGTAARKCTMCDGSKVVPEAWTETNNPKIDNDPNYIRLKDGRVFRGKIVMTTDTKVKIRTDSGIYIDTTKDQIVSKAESGNSR